MKKSELNLKFLENSDDYVVNKLAEFSVPKNEKERIFKISQNLLSENNSEDYSDDTEVFVLRKNKQKSFLSAASALLILTGALGGGLLYLSRFSNQPIVSTNISETETTTAETTSAEFSDSEKAHQLIKSVSENHDSYYVIRLRENAFAQDGGKNVQFRCDIIEELFSILSEKEWIKSDEDLSVIFHGKNYFIGEMFISESGIIGNNEICYYPSDNETESYMKILTESLFSDKLGYMQYLTEFPEESCENMSAVIDNMNYQGESVSGKMKIDYTYGTEYTEIKGTDKNCYAMLYGMETDGFKEYALLETGNDTDESMEQLTDENGITYNASYGNKFYNAPELSYQQIKSEIKSQMVHLHEFADEITDISSAEENGIYVFNIQKNMEDGFMADINIKIDRKGTVLLWERTVHENPQINDNSDKTDYILVSLSNVCYDESDNIPDIPGYVQEYLEKFD
ncbi:MAG: hypothetical protein MJ081_03555 [Ruminococcus sp.]|nr:hypothetical protein [Ruminococcus sp.]